MDDILLSFPPQSAYSNTYIMYRAEAKFLFFELCILCRGTITFIGILTSSYLILSDYTYTDVLFA